MAQNGLARSWKLEVCNHSDYGVMDQLTTSIGSRAVVQVRTLLRHFKSDLML